MSGVEPKKPSEVKEVKETKEAKGSKDSKDSKRKAVESPEQDKQYLRLRRRGSLPDLQEVQSASGEKKSDIIRKGLLDPDTMKEFIPIIIKHLQPSIESSIESAIERSMEASITRAVNSALHKFKSEVMDPILERKDTEIDYLKSQIEQKDNQIKTLEQSNTKIVKNLNDLDQYGRRQNIRLNNVPLGEDDDCEEVVLRIINRALPDGETLTSSEISRCHPLGKVNRNNNRQVIVKFVSYKAKAKVYAARFNLSNIYMSEDFTPSNQKIMDKLVACKKAKRIKSFWTIDGKIFAKVHDAQPRTRIFNIDNIESMITTAVNEGYVNISDMEITTET